jgi:hypothetical protein
MGWTGGENIRFKRAAGWGLCFALSFLIAAAGSEAAQYPQLRELSEQELADIIVGNGIYCSRGIDTMNEISAIKAAIHAGQHFRMVSLEDLPDDWLAVSEFGVGGGGAWPEVRERYKGVDLSAEEDTTKPETVLTHYLGGKFQAMYSMEAGQFWWTLLQASRLDLPIINGDATARCVPEVSMSFVNGGVQWAPFGGKTIFGDSFIFPTVRDSYRVEDMTRGLAVSSGGSVDIVTTPLTGKVLKKNLVPDFFTLSEAVGRAAREAVLSHADPVAAVATAGHGYVLFRGTVIKSETRGERGFGWTIAELAGTGSYAGSIYRIFNKNENMIAWRNGKLDAAAPDIIAALDPKTGWAMRGSTTMIGGFVVGQELAIVGLPAAATNRTPKAIAVLGPHHFGFNQDYVPLEVLHGGRKPQI